MADYALPCPVCNGGMYDQLAPTNKYPYKPGTPIAVCKRKKEGCTGVIWAPKGMPINVPQMSVSNAPQYQAIPGAPQYAIAPAPTRGPIMQADANPSVETYAELVKKHTAQHFTILADVAIRYGQLIDEAKGTTKEILATATADTLHAIAATIAIGLQRR